MRMNLNYSRWLKDDLNLVHFCETDLNGLLFHPRHGSLCRRLAKIIAESSLCSVRYTTVFAKEEYEEAVAEHTKKREIRQTSLDKLNNYARDQENIETEVSFLVQKLEYLKKIEDLQQTSRAAMEDILGRPDCNLEQVSRMIDSADYLNDDQLKNLYAIDDSDKLVDSTPTETDMSKADESWVAIVNKVNVMNLAINRLYDKITEAIDKNQCDVSLKKLHVAGLVALKIPTFKELHLEADPIKKELRTAINELELKKQELDQQVCKLEKNYLKEKSDIVKVAKDSLKEKCIAKFGCPDKIAHRIEKLNSAISANYSDNKSNE